MVMPRVKPLLGDTRRTWVGLTIAACLVVVLVTGLLFKGQTGADGFDNAVDSPLIALFSGHSVLLEGLILPGAPIAAILISAVIAAGCLITRRWNGTVLAVIIVPTATGLSDGLLKHLFHRTYVYGLSFPSGHTTCVAGLAATLAILLLLPPQQARTRWIRVALMAAACLITAAVAIGVIAIRFHYFTDTVGGAAVGVGTALALAFLIDLGAGVVTRSRNLPSESTANRAAQSASAE